ncbi:LUD domain-containing protein [Oleiagrimonas sp. C23AA]|uniref:LutC/YkgG family protein n=1 Tax=Oleiagrimonas sp. C23AA TaxID=2719047 RepID=UPI001424798C|nr:LUD domain-containing protein [Oleiagrimonas sp. C23AA]NII10639.1 LUD domain-containing protein [Oleiagrimonas sp. C23AA]
MNARQSILAALRDSGRQRGTLPEPAAFASDQDASMQAFAKALEAMNGQCIGPMPPQQALDTLFPQAARVVSVTPEVRGQRKITTNTDPRSLEDVEVAVLRAPFGVAETGSVFVSEKVLVCNALAYYAQHLLVLLDPAQLVASIHDAYARDEFSGTRYAALITGPSATADIEGVLVRGAQGPRSLSVCWCPTSQAS